MEKALKNIIDYEYQWYVLVFLGLLYVIMAIKYVILPEKDYFIMAYIPTSILPALSYIIYLSTFIASKYKDIFLNNLLYALSFGILISMLNAYYNPLNLKYLEIMNIFIISIFVIFSVLITLIYNIYFDFYQRNKKSIFENN